MNAHCYYDYETIKLVISYKNNTIKIDPSVVEGTDFMNDQTVLDYLHYNILDEDKRMWIEIEYYD
jgi:hypothetical protein